MIPVTKSFLPPIDEYMAQIQRAYEKGWLTNRGELVRELEKKISIYLQLGSTNILCTNNGTIPLQIALKLLGNGGEIITTPFSYVATTAAIVWENCKPVFVDIHCEHLTIDESKIEKAITPKTTCILATHVFGNPCNIEKIDQIAKKYNLKVIYDAAHCFGVKYNGKSIFEFGNVSTCSFHATKTFHTAEGGAIFTNDNNLFEKIKLSHSFGHIGDEYFSIGINAKMSELHASMGLSVFPFIDKNKIKRKQITDCYEQYLAPKFKRIKIRKNTDWNYSYYPIIFENEASLLKAIKKLNAKSIFPRRYFYPSLNNLNYVDQAYVPNSEDVCSKILCLPLYPDLELSSIIQICNVLNS